MQPNHVPGPCRQPCYFARSMAGPPHALNVNEAMHDAIKYAIDKGVPVIIATKVYNGRALPIYGSKGGGNMLLKAGAVFAGDLTPDKARVMALLALPITKEQKALQAYYDKSRRGFGLT